MHYPHIIPCYIEEYTGPAGRLCVRLRDKVSDRKVVLSGQHVSKEHLILFLSQARVHTSAMPTIYQREGNDIVAVLGCVVSATSEEIEVNIDVPFGGYLFE